MHIRFEIRDFGDEAAALQALNEGRAPAEADHLWGSIVIEQAGQAPVVLKDDLTSLGRGACAKVPELLRREGRASLAVGDWPTDYLFEAQAGTVHLTGPGGEDASFPQDELLDGLNACGRRLLAFIERLALTCPQYAFSGRSLAAKLPQ